MKRLRRAALVLAAAGLFPGFIAGASLKLEYGDGNSLVICQLFPGFIAGASLKPTNALPAPPPPYQLFPGFIAGASLKRRGGC